MSTTTTPAAETPAAAVDAGRDTPVDVLPDDKPEEFATIAAEAEQIRTGSNYDGRMTLELMVKLEPLLRRPIDAKYVKHTPPTQGKPYHSTGLRSIQPLVDRMNDVLGMAHWRSLTHFEDDGTTCRFVVIVGNNLGLVRLTSDGEIDPASCDGAEILVTRHGWGSHTRGSNKGDILKGAETNAAKRVFAAIGPGNNVLRLDIDNDVHNQGDEYRPPRQQPTATVGDKPATSGQQNLIRKIAAERGVGDAQLCNVIFVAAGSAPIGEAEALAQMEAGLLERLPGKLVNPVLDALRQAQPAAIPVPAPVAPAMGPLPVQAPPAAAAPAPAAPAPVTPAPVPAAAPAGATVHVLPTAAPDSLVAAPQPPAAAQTQPAPVPAPAAPAPATAAPAAAPGQVGELGTQVDRQAVKSELDFSQLGPAPTGAPATGQAA